jgi:alpha-D-ribose 1-methylphosphonate 5-triphosphate diphosphatase PhnM
MTQLLSIEQNFLSLPTVKMGFNLTEVKKVQRDIANAQKSKFKHTMHLAKCVKTAVDYFKSEQCQALMQVEGITWNTEMFGEKVFGFKKSYLHKLNRAANLSEQIIEGYNAKCDEQGADAERSLAGLLEFAKNINIEVSEDATAEEIAEATAEAIEGASVERAKTIFTMSFKGAEGNVSVRIDENGKMHTTNSRADILNAISFLAGQMPTE